MNETTRPKIVDYRELRWSNLNSERFRHLKLLLFWPIFGLLFWFVEKVGVTDRYHVVYCALDDTIPFCEFFVIPYLLWFLLLAGMVIYTLLFDTESFKKFMWFIIVTYSVTLLVYLIYPTAQELRPAAFERDNIFTRFMRGFYAFDTNTNVCPSIHVIGALAAMFAAWHSRHFHAVGWRIAFGVTATLICLSTVFLKQHSALDVLYALPLCAVAYYFLYRHKPRKAKQSELPVQEQQTQEKAS